MLAGAPASGNDGRIQRNVGINSRDCHLYEEAVRAKENQIYSVYERLHEESRALPVAKRHRSGVSRARDSQQVQTMVATPVVVRLIFRGWKDC